MKRILVVKGSPRAGGNTDLLADKAIEGVLSKGGLVIEILLRNESIKPCIACESCSDENIDCIIEDDMKKFYKSIEEADGIILASPVYWFNMSGQMKLFIDRWFSVYMKNELFLENKQAGIIMTYADEDAFSSGAVNAFRTFQDIFNHCGGEIAGIVHATAGESGEIATNDETLSKAFELGKKMAQ
ncbi:MAG: flavodoxin family protein [Eubacteriales bacterium]